MNSGHFAKKAIFLLTLYLSTSKVSNTAQQSNNQNDTSTTELKIRNLIRSFDSYTWMKNDRPKQFFDDKTFQFKDDMDTFAKQLEYDEFKLHRLLRETLLHKVTKVQRQLSLNLTNHNDLVELATRIQNLKRNFDFLQKNSTNATNGTRKLHKIATLLDNFQTEVNNRIENLEREQELAPLKRLIDDCVNEITHYRLDSAVKKLHEINHERNFQLVVKEMYNLGEENFYVLLNFVDRFRNNPRKAEYFYEVLYYEKYLTRCETLTLYQILLMIRRFPPLINELGNRNDSEHREENEGLKQQAELFLDTLKNSANTAAIEEITDAFILNYLSKIEPHIFELAETGFADMNVIIEAVIGRISRKLATNHLSTVIHSNEGLCINEITQTPLTSRLKRILSWSKYCVLSQDVKKIAMRALNSSPASIGLGPIEYCEKVCIMNVNYNEYLYDPDKSECADKNTNISCSAYTTEEPSIGKPNQLAWNLKPTGNNKFQIISYNHNYTLFVGNEKVDHERRSVSTRRSSEDDDQYEWQFIFYDDFVLIENIHYKEYLTTSVKGYINNVTTIDLRSMVTTSKRLRKVFTVKKENITPNCYWIIRGCP